ncbi:hypothetical protein EYR40_010516 [Pleurotus pulmonarius]|nr:hypothetical protein EYR38_010795 [Pleurotus pulmonarius]KAF4588960.1 hypothetical protein EYR40_010516 [Pleurotus pulmonarius]
MTTLRVRSMEVNNQSTFDGTVYVVKDGQSYEVGPTDISRVQWWDLGQLQVKVVTKHGTSYTCCVVITYEAVPPNEAEYLVHGTVQEPKIDYQAIKRPGPGQDEACIRRVVINSSSAPFDGTVYVVKVNKDIVKLGVVSAGKKVTFDLTLFGFDNSDDLHVKITSTAGNSNTDTNVVTYVRTADYEAVYDVTGNGANPNISLDKIKPI